MDRTGKGRETESGIETGAEGKIEKGMEKELQAQIESGLSVFPVCEYAFISTEDIPFREEVRYICETECPRYGTSWSCPPAVGTVAECRERCSRFDGGLLFTTVAEEVDVEDMSAMLATRREHEEVTRQVRDHMRAFCREMQVLSTESCALCETCAYPAPCRHPEHMFPCIESYGILVTELTEKYGMTFMSGGNMVTWFSLILYRAL